jgi:hypothetical protein
MDKAQFNAVLPILVSSLLDLMVRSEGFSEAEALDELYQSKLYAALEIEEMKVWQYSKEKLYELYRQEKSEGELIIPEY